MKRRAFLFSAAGLSAAATVSACTAGTNPDGGESPDGSANSADTGSGGGFLVMTAGPAPTFVRNYNQPSPASEKGPGAALMYEPLLRTLWLQAGEVEPWLAESFEWNSDGTELTFKLRTDVTWSDGEAFDAEDVLFTLGLWLENPEFNRSGSTYTSVEQVDESSVRATWDEPAFTEITKFGTSGGLEILPEHLYAGQDLNTWTNEEPVGTGAYVLSSFSPQQVTFTARDDYWNGEQTVRELRIPASTDEATRPLVLAGDIDVTTMAWPNPEEEFVGANPEKNRYAAISNGTAESLLFNNMVAPFDDVNVRRAISHCLDAAQMISLYDVGTSPANVSGMNYEIFEEIASPEFEGMVATTDADAATAALEESGYTVENGQLTKDGQSYSLELKLPQGNTNWVTWARGFAEQVSATLGLDVAQNPISDETFWPTLETGDFGMALGFAGGGLGAFAAFSALASEYALPVGEPTPMNQFRYQNAEVDEALERLQRTDDNGEIAEICEIIQTRIVEDVPFYPLADAAWFLAYTENRWTNWPDPDDREIVPTWMHGPDWTLTLQQLTPVEG